MAIAYQSLSVGRNTPLFHLRLTKDIRSQFLSKIGSDLSIMFVNETNILNVINCVEQNK
jgi:hypothetical protein